MDRRLFVQKLMLLLAFASTYRSAKASNVLLGQPEKNFDSFFTKARELGI